TARRLAANGGTGRGRRTRAPPASFRSGSRTSASTSNARSLRFRRATARPSSCTTSRDTRMRRRRGVSAWIPARRRASSLARARRCADCWREELMGERNDLTAEEARALAALASGPLPPPGLEDATVTRLAAQGLLDGRRPRRFAAPIAAAAAIALFAAG